MFQSYPGRGIISQLSKNVSYLCSALLLSLEPLGNLRAAGEPILSGKEEVCFRAQMEGQPNHVVSSREVVQQHVPALKSYNLDSDCLGLKSGPLNIVDIIIMS